MIRASCFHPSLGIPLIITLELLGALEERDRSFHPSLGIPLIITWGSLFLDPSPDKVSIPL